MEKVLFVAVHPDDETLGCGGTILKHRENGDEIYWLIMTKADQRFTSINGIEEKQKKYVKQVTDEYNFKNFYHLNFITTELDKYNLRDIISEINAIIQETEPTMIYLPNRSDVHSDHKIAFEAAYACTKNFRAPFIKKIFMYETLSETEFAPALPGIVFNPNVFVDISEFLEPKLSIMQIYETEIMKEPYPRSLSSIKALARYRGSRIGVKYAEAFMLLFERT